MAGPLLQLRPLERVLRQPLVTARGRYTVRAGLRLTLRAADGVEGWGEAMPLPSFGTESLEACRARLEAWGRAVHADVPPHLEALGAWLGDFAGHPAARHALEEAALDVQARRAGVPLWRWLAADEAHPGPAQPSVPVNALLSSRAPQALAEEGQEAVAEGFRTLKVKVAAAPLEEDVARLSALRARVGPEVHLRLDANGGWTREEARAALQALAPMRPELCEQPVSEEDVEGLAWLRGQVPCALGADEALAHPARALEVVQRRAADVLVLKPMVLGGLLPALALARAGRAGGMEAVVTSSLDGVVARAGAAHLAGALGAGGQTPHAHGLAVGGLFTDEPAHPFRPRGGAIRLPARPGLGLQAEEVEP